MNARRFHRANARRGMVLLEVIIALTIFSIVSVGLIVALDQSFDAGQDRNQADKAARGLRNQLALLHAAPLSPGTRDVPDDGSGTTYQVEIDPAPMSDQHQQPLLGLYRATVFAQWKEGKNVQKQSVSELMYQP